MAGDGVLGCATEVDGESGRVASRDDEARSETSWRMNEAGWVDAPSA